VKPVHKVTIPAIETKVLLLPAITNKVYIYQQESAPAYRALQTVELLHHENRKFIAPDLATQQPGP